MISYGNTPLTELSIPPKSIPNCFNEPPETNDQASINLNLIEYFDEESINCLSDDIEPIKMKIRPTPFNYNEILFSSESDQ